MKISITQLKTYASIALMTLGVFGVMSTACAYSSYIPSGETAYQWSWGGKAAIMFSVCALVSILLSTKGIAYFHKSVIWGLILIGGVEAIWGLRQIYGFATSHHSLYAVTGSFFNPGPYSGYLALVFPICLHEWLSLNAIKHHTEIEKVTYFFSLGILLLLISVLPAGMSRSAWIAAVVSGVLVCGIHYHWVEWLKKTWKMHRKRTTVIICLLVICVLLSGFGIYTLKPDSAKGRLFMWKISSLAISEKPFTGHGIGNFVQAYGHAQESYFSAGNYSEAEERVAGSPAYAFNEYFRIATECGIPVLLVILIGIGYCFYHGIRYRRIGICGGILSLLIFSFSSYPMEFPCFIFSLIFLLIACLTERSRVLPIIFVLLIGAMGVRIVSINQYEACRSWSQCRMLYDVHVYSRANEEYNLLYPKLRDRSRFLFEYGRSLYNQKRYRASIIILKEASEVSCDPMILNVIAKNYLALKEYEEAEKWLIRSTHLLPGRIYPYYLLAKLYAEPAYSHPEKLKYLAGIVLTKEPKVQSTAIKEMREEIKSILRKSHFF